MILWADLSIGIARYRKLNRCNSIRLFKEDNSANIEVINTRV